MLGKSSEIMPIWWIVFLSFVVIYGLAMTIYAQGQKEKRWALNLIPGYAFFATDKYTDGFRCMTVPVKKWGKLIGILALLCYVATEVTAWGNRTLSESEAGFLGDIMILPLIFSTIIIWLGTANATKKIVINSGLDIPCLTLITLTFVSVPVLLVLCRKKERKNIYGV